MSFANYDVAQRAEMVHDLCAEEERGPVPGKSKSSRLGAKNKQAEHACSRNTTLKGPESSVPVKSIANQFIC